MKQKGKYSPRPRYHVAVIGEKETDSEKSRSGHSGCRGSHGRHFLHDEIVSVKCRVLSNNTTKIPDGQAIRDFFRCLSGFSLHNEAAAAIHGLGGTVNGRQTDTRQQQGDEEQAQVAFFDIVPKGR